MTLVLATQRPGEPEIFASLQGEGASAGRPVAFVRFSRCNLACTWCDTAYTWHFEGDDRPHRDDETYSREDNQITLEVKDVAERIQSLGQKRLVITGGEPLLQARPMSDLLAALPDLEIEIETNGTIKPIGHVDIWVDQYNVSPKLAHSGNRADLALVPEALEFFAGDPRAFFKFVIAEPEDIEQVIALQTRYRIKPERLFLMPEGRSSPALQRREKWLSALCLEHGWRMSDRLHIHLYGDERGT